MKQIKLTKEKNDAEILRKKQVEDKFAGMTKAKITPATETDKEMALEKITRAASVHQGSVMHGVKSLIRDVTPEAFQEQALAFLLHYLGELDAMIQLFDTNGDGEISSVEFLTTFSHWFKKKKKNIDL